ncbi:MAG: lipoprotein insertase outer membrane protein LolB [Pseudomonadales bacterium]|nr:lipoprotein insertase outer membrane protein LolB [Pseudomonadales bacterium]
MPARPHFLLPVLALLLLGACSSTPQIDAPVTANWELRRAKLNAITQWEFTGRIGVRDDQESHSSRIRWRQNDRNFVINLWGALNIGATEISGNPERVRLQQEGEEPLLTSSPEELIREQLGYELPVSLLDSWIKGVPAPGLNHIPIFNETDQLLQLQQAGWHIQYLGYTSAGLETMPSRIRMEKAPLRLDFVRLNWTLE